MGKKYDAYEMAVQAENQAKERYAKCINEENKNNAIQAERNANMVFGEFLEDPEG